MSIPKNELDFLNRKEARLFDQSFSTNINPFRQRDFNIERPRVNRVLKKIADYPLTMVCAGTGYGKTRAVFSFLQKLEGAHTTWIQLTERDNIPARFWESYVGTTAMTFPENAKVLEWIGFPESKEAKAKYEYLLRDVEYRPGRFLVVFDDFHLLHNKTVLGFFDIFLSKMSSNTNVILISRTMPDLNVMELMLKDNVFIVSENDLLFTRDEVDMYFQQLAIPATVEDIQNIYEDTQGWAFAISLIGRSLEKDRKYVRNALEAMKKNIYRLIDAEVSQSVSKPMLNFLLRISLIDNLAANLIKELAGDDKLIEELGSLNAYIRYDYGLDSYHVHHLFLDYLRSLQHMLIDEEIHETYKKAAAWCDKNGYSMDALSYYEKSGDYSSLLLKTYKYDAHYLPASHDISKHILEILERAPDDLKTSNPLYPMTYFKIKVSLGHYEGTEEEIKAYIDNYKARPESDMNNRVLTALYGAWGLLRRDLSTYNDTYDFDACYRQMAEYYDKSPFTSTGSYESMLPCAWASLAGAGRAGAPEAYADAIERCVPYTSRVLNGLVVGYDDLIRGEMYFYRGDFGSAERYLKQAIDNAAGAGQFLPRNSALTYLMRISIIRGDFAGATAWLGEIEKMLECAEFKIRYETYDIARGIYQLAMDSPEGIQEWLKGDFSKYVHPAFLENYGNRIKAQYHYQTGRYSLLLAFVDGERGHPSILYGKIELKILEALALYKLKRRAESFAALFQAYDLSSPNDIITPFFLQGKDMRTLTAAALKDPACGIPREWLKNINRKSSAYAKKKQAVISEYLAVNKIDRTVSLTKREIEVIKDLAQGLSRSEVAASQNISVNTVKMVVNTIYEKLGANNLLDIIRIATEKKII